MADDLFKMKLKQFQSDLHREYEFNESNMGDPTKWDWYVQGRYRDWAIAMNLNLLRESQAANVVTRENYVKLRTEIYHLDTQLHHLLSNLPEWMYLLPEMHCRVIESGR